MLHVGRVDMRWGVLSAHTVTHVTINVLWCAPSLEYSAALSKASGDGSRKGVVPAMALGVH